MNITQFKKLPAKEAFKHLQELIRLHDAFERYTKQLDREYGRLGRVYNNLHTRHKNDPQS